VVGTAEIALAAGAFVVSKFVFPALLTKALLITRYPSPPVVFPYHYLGHHAEVLTVVWSPDGKWIASASGVYGFQESIPLCIILGTATTFMMISRCKKRGMHAEKSRISYLC
jgi:hypothetical protein